MVGPTGVSGCALGWEIRGARRGGFSTLLRVAASQPAVQRKSHIQKKKTYRRATKPIKVEFEVSPNPALDRRCERLAHARSRQRDIFPIPVVGLYVLCDLFFFFLSFVNLTIYLSSFTSWIGVQPFRYSFCGHTCCLRASSLVLLLLWGD